MIHDDSSIIVSVGGLSMYLVPRIYTITAFLLFSEGDLKKEAWSVGGELPTAAARLQQQQRHWVIS